MDDILARANDEGQLAFSIIEAGAERVLARMPVTAGTPKEGRRSKEKSFNAGVAEDAQRAQGSAEYIWPPRF